MVIDTNFYFQRTEFDPECSPTGMIQACLQGSSQSERFVNIYDCEQIHCMYEMIVIIHKVIGVLQAGPRT